MHRLQNKVYISTRPLEQNEELKQLLEKEGASVLSMPTIAIEGEHWSNEKEDILRNIADFQWLVFTSANGVRYFFEKYHELLNGARLPLSVRIAVVGRKTASIVEKYGYEVQYINRGNGGEELAKEMLEFIQPEEKVLLALGDLARKSLELALKQRVTCIRLEVYKTILPTSVDELVLNRILENRYDSIIIASPSALRNLLIILDNRVDLKELKLTSIGATTTAEVLEVGLKPTQTATMASAQGLLEAIVRNELK